jgi:inhibitor of cysteine peptidase
MGKKASFVLWVGLILFSSLFNYCKTSFYDNTDIELAAVETISVLLLESFPVQAKLEIHGYFPTPCYELVPEKTAIVRDGNEFFISLYQKKTNKSDENCIQVICPFSCPMTLDILGLSAGMYSVHVNGINTSFTLDTNNNWQ